MTAMLVLSVSKTLEIQINLIANKVTLIRWLDDRQVLINIELTRAEIDALAGTLPLCGQFLDNESVGDYENL